MRVVHFAAGAGDMYCGACARDMAMARGLIKRGHDVEIVPLYTPLKIDGAEPTAPAPVFLGGLNMWLQQHLPLFRSIPQKLDRILDHPSVLRGISRFAVSTKPSKLGPMTVSVLAGQDGRQRKEVARLLEYLRTQPPPDVLSLTNSLLSGLAPALKQEYPVPLVCALQGEESFVAMLPPRHRGQAQDLMRKNAGCVDLFLSPADGYSDMMAEFLAVPRERIATARPGIDVAQFSRPRQAVEPFTIGYLSVIIPRKGLDLLVAAWIRLVQQGADVRLRVAGAVLNEKYLQTIKLAIAHEGLTDRCEFLGEVDLPAKVDFLHGCSVFSVPSRFPESRGMAVMEAMAAGVPVVAPDCGVYPELFALTGAGLLHQPDDVESLAAALKQVMEALEQAATTAQGALAGLQEHYGLEVTAERLEKLLLNLTS